MQKKVLLSVTIVLMTLLLTVGCAKKDSNTLYLFNWTYYTPDAVIEQFEEEFNCEVKIDNYSSNEEMYTKIKAGATGYDIVFPSQDFASIMTKQDMFEKLDHSKLPNLQNVNKVITDKLTYDPNMNYSVPYGSTISGIAVNTEKVTDYEKSWSIFENKELAKSMTMLDDMREVMSATLLYLGYSVNTTDDDELADAYDVLKNKWAPNLIKFDAEGFGKSFASGDFLVCHGYAENIFGEVPEERWDTFDYFIPKEGVPLYVDSMAILKGAKNIELAHEFINFIHRPEVYALFLDDMGFPAVLNMPAAEFTTAKPMYEIEDASIFQIPGDLGEDIAKYDAIWQSVRISY